MKILLATGIHPPDIGGPATYVEKLAEELHRAGHTVTVVAYGFATELILHERGWTIVRVRKSGGPLLRWKRFAGALREYGTDADIIIAFSSVSCGVPLRIAKLKNPKKILRLGGDFFWERYTALHGKRGLRDWHKGKTGDGMKERLIFGLTRLIDAIVMPGLLKSFDHLVYSTAYQQAVHEQCYPRLPSHSVIENALPVGDPVRHTPHVPLRLLYLGRFVGFKHLPALVKAMALLPDVILTLTGDGPTKTCIEKEIRRLGLGDRVRMQEPVSGADKRKLFDAHDLMIMPSLTEISPHSALEANSAGLPVLITTETGLSDELTAGMLKADMRTPEEIVVAVHLATERYTALADAAVSPMERRNWNVVAKEWMETIGLNG